MTTPIDNVIADLNAYFSQKQKRDRRCAICKTRHCTRFTCACECHIKSKDVEGDDHSH